MRYGETPLAVLRRVKDKIREISPGLPEKTLADGRISKIRIVPFYDRTGIIYETIDTLRKALTEEAIAAGIVVYLLGIDSNIMSLAGLAIAIGDVADMGVIMTENIYRHIAKNDGSKTYYQCVEAGAFEVGT